MEMGIIGLPKSGKTTVFNALTRGHAQTAAFASGGEQPNVGVAKVPDHRLDRLAEICKPQRIVPAEVRYLDIHGTPDELGRGQSISGQFLNLLERVDGLLLVVRAFQDPAVPHPQGAVDPERDLSTMLAEMTLADLVIMERRLQRLEDSLKGAKPQQREAAQKEKSLLEGIKAALEEEIPVREQQLSHEGLRLLENYRFLTAKPLLTVWNIGEEDVEGAAELEAKHSRTGAPVAVLCGKLEMELAQMEPQEEQEFRQALGVGESGLNRMISLSHEALGLISFFTTGSDELKAWTIPRETPALKAAGKIHSDMEHGFIRAEVVSFDDLDRCGSVAEARRQGVLRLEGKTYPVQDGDVVTFLFNV